MSSRRHSSRRSAVLSEVLSSFAIEDVAPDIVPPLHVSSGSPKSKSPIMEGGDLRQKSESLTSSQRSSMPNNNRLMPSRALILSTKASSDSGMTPEDKDKYKVRRKRRRQLRSNTLQGELRGAHPEEAGESRDKVCFFIEGECACGEHSVSLYFVCIYLYLYLCLLHRFSIHTDLHFADSATIETIAAARAEFPDILWVMSMRNIEEEADAVLEAQIQKERYVCV
jgi:hypothetical protein